MNDVYELESQIAWYPRIVIGNKLNNNISDWGRKIEEKSSYYVFYNEIIKSCKAMICAERDGMPILDYLGELFFKVSDPIPQMKTNVQLGWEFISREYERYKNCREPQMALRYSLLKEYYSSRLEIWGII